MKSMGTKLVNVSLCKPAHQSSQSPWSGELGAAGALQFDVQSPFGFHTSLENAPWWVCDLLCIYPIDRIVIYDRASGFSDRSKTIKVEISINEQDWILVHQGLVFINGDGPDENTPFVLPLSGKISARFVRLSLEERQYFHLKKIEILVKETDIRASEGNKRNYPLREYNPGTPKIRAAILGTSNALNGGYPEALKRANIEVVANASIGSSHSCLIPYRLADIENIDIDVLILDFHVNDQRALNGGFDFQPMTSHILDFVKNWVSRKKIIPIMLILPKKVNFESERMDAKLKLIKMCKDKENIIF